MAASTAQPPRLVTLIRTPLPPGFVAPVQYGVEQTTDDQLQLNLDEDEKTSIRNLQDRIEEIRQKCIHESNDYEDTDFMRDTQPPKCKEFTTYKRPQKNGIVIKYPKGHKEYPWSLNRQSTPADILQGSFDDCWLANAISLLSFRVSLIKRIVVNRYLNREGVYGVRLFIGGQWCSLIIDDQFPCGKEGALIGTWAVDQQLWPTIVEKAVAKAFGGYRHIEGGTTTEGLKLLTGYCAEILWLVRYTKTEMFTVLESELQYGSLIGLGTKKKDLCNPSQLDGFPELHAFGLMATYSYSDIQLLRIRNIHGTNKYTGKWAAGSDAWDAIPEEYRPIDEIDGPDGGVLWIDMDELYRYFQMVEVCYVRPDWHSSQQGIMFPTPHLPLCYVTEIEIYANTKIHLHTMQQNAKNRTSGDLEAALVAFDENWNLAYFSKYTTSSAATWLQMLGEGRFKVFCLSFTGWRSHKEVKYSVLCDSSRPIRMYESPMRIEQLKEAIIRLVRVRGEVNQFEGGSGLMTAHVMQPRDWYGIIVVAINQHPSRYFHVYTNLTNAGNASSTRDTTATRDVIAPRRAQVLNISTGAPIPEGVGLVDHQVILGESDRPMPTYQGNTGNYPTISEREVLHNAIPIPRASN